MEFKHERIFLFGLWSHRLFVQSITEAHSYNEPKSSESASFMDQQTRKAICTMTLIETIANRKHIEKRKKKVCINNAIVPIVRNNCWESKNKKMCGTEFVRCICVNQVKPNEYKVMISIQSNRLQLGRWVFSNVKNAQNNIRWCWIRKAIPPPPPRLPPTTKITSWIRMDCICCCIYVCTFISTAATVLRVLRAIQNTNTGNTFSVFFFSLFVLSGAGRRLLHSIASWHLFIHSLCVAILCIIYRFGAFFTIRTQIHQRSMHIFLADLSSCEILYKPNEKWTSVPLHISNFTFDCAVYGVTQFPISSVRLNSVIFSLLLMLLLVLFARISFSNTKFIFMIIMSEMCAQIANK